VARPRPLLLDLAAGRLPREAPADPALLVSAVDHGMHGLLWTWVRDHAPAYPERARLAGFDAATRQRHHRLGVTLSEVRDRLRDVGVEVVVLKGVTAEVRYYDRAGERPSTDVDVLVAPAARARAGAVVRALDPAHPLVEVVDSLVDSGGVQSVDVRLDGQPVDVHFDLYKLGYAMRAPDVVWEHTEEIVAPDGTLVRVLRPELALVHFLVHANKDSFPRLIGYADVVRVMGRRDLDWDLVVQLAGVEGLTDVVACALDTITDALDVAPGPLPRRAGLRTRVWRITWPERVTLLGASGPTRSRRQEVLPFLVRGRLVDAMRAAVRIVLPARAAVVARYSGVRGPYPVRLVRGRRASATARRLALRARDTPSIAPPTESLVARPAGEAAVDGSTKAALLRARLGTGSLWLDVTGRSMGWSIPDGSRVRVDRALRPARGEVWAFCTPSGDLVVHRLRGVGPDGARFQGDVCVRADAPVTADLLVGKVVEVGPGRRRASWGPAAAAVQRVPRVAVAGCVRAARRVAGSRT
jgi:hypothetical protein